MKRTKIAENVKFGLDCSTAVISIRQSSGSREYSRKRIIIAVGKSVLCYWLLFTLNSN